MMMWLLINLSTLVEFRGLLIYIECFEAIELKFYLLRWPRNWFLWNDITHLCGYACNSKIVWVVYYVLSLYGTVCMNDWLGDRLAEGPIHVHLSNHISVYLLGGLIYMISWCNSLLWGAPSCCRSIPLTRLYVIVPVTGLWMTGWALLEEFVWPWNSVLIPLSIIDRCKMKKGTSIDSRLWLICLLQTHNLCACVDH